MRDTTHSIAHSAGRFFSGTMLSRLTGFLRDIIMAFAFGTQEAAAAFLVAFRLAHLLRRLLGEGALQTAFIPHFEKLRREDPVRSGAFFCDLAAGISGLLIVIAAIVMALLGGIVLWGDLAPGNREIVILTLIMMPSLVFICLYGLNASLLQCEKNFFLSSVAPCAFNAIWIVGLFCLWKWEASQAMPWLSLFIIVACAAQWAVTLPKTLAILRGLGVRSLYNVKWLSQDLRLLAKPLFLGMIGISAAQINNALDSLFARYAEPEGPAYLWYAIRIQQLPLALFGIAISGALLPPLARAIKNNDAANYTRFLDFALRRSLAIMLPITVGIFLLGELSIQLIYGRGLFSADSVQGTTGCLWAYGFGLIPMTFVLILGPAFYAQDDYRTPSQGAVLAMGLNVILNTLMISGLGLGAASVAWATSISAWFNFFYLAHFLRKRMAIISSAFWPSMAKISLATAAGSAGLLSINYWLAFGTPWMNLLVQLGAFLAPFLVVAKLCKVDDILGWMPNAFLDAKTQRRKEEG